jgi:hypothetical protein
MQRLGILFVLLLGFGALAVSVQDVPFRLDSNIDFSKYKTYRWVHTDHKAYPVDPRIGAAIDAELEKKGLKKTDSEETDAFFCYHSNFGTEKMHKYHTEGEAEANPDMFFTVQNGEVAIDMYDSATKKLIWRNTAKINPKAKPEHVTNAVSKLLKNYPPRKA